MSGEEVDSKGKAKGAFEVMKHLVMLIVAAILGISAIFSNA